MTLLSPSGETNGHALALTPLRTHRKSWRVDANTRIETQEQAAIRNTTQISLHNPGKAVKISVTEIIRDANAKENNGDISGAIRLLCNHLGSTFSGPAEWLWFEIASKSLKVNDLSTFEEFSSLFLNSPATRADNYKGAYIPLLRQRIEKRIPLGDDRSLEKMVSELLSLSGRQEDFDIVSRLGLPAVCPLPTTSPPDYSIPISRNAPEIENVKSVNYPHYVELIATRRRGVNTLMHGVNKCEYISDGDSFAILRGDDAYYYTSNSQYFEDKIHQIKQLLGSPFKLDGKAVVVSDRFGGENYCHWLLDWMARAVVADGVRGPMDWVLAHCIERGFQNDSFRAFFPNRNVRLLNGKRVCWLAFDELSYFEPAHVDNLHPTFWGDSNALHEMRRRIFSRVQNAIPKPNRTARKLYISRADARGRRAIINEAELTERLVKLGFEIVTLSELDFKSQVLMFESASIVIGVHGAGLTNMIFMNERSNILEIFYKSYGTPAYIRIAQSLGLNYAYYSCGSSAEDDHSGRLSEHSNAFCNVSVYVDVDRIAQYIESLVLTPSAPSI
ncbi:glycosyltransferase family 61 protein [Rhodoblastus sp.]|uniref:glycosyltransferase family 61 protein n=1 Tax=Rhodoblastus sp. TaxID=1962975 RepID=UPI0025E13C72|nr:glycosyltransferase family 61 protein [Rhodoblastus sp.]